MLWVFKPTAHKNMKQQTPLCSTRRRSFILTLLGPNDSFLKSLLKRANTYQNLKTICQIHYEKTVSNCLYLCWGIRARVPKEGEASHGPSQPMPRPHGHLKCHWLTKFLPLSNLIKPYQALIPPIPCKFHSTYPIINSKTEFSPTTTNI
jgi:hypothetical protein